MENNRLFVAVDIAESIRDTIRSELYKSTALKNARWVRPENLHLTLKFIGDVRTIDIESVKRVIEKAAAGKGSTTLRYSGMGVFPNVSRARVLWLGFGDGSNILSKVVRGLDEGLFDSLKIEKDTRTFTPHLTVARFKGGVDQSSLKQFLDSGMTLKDDSFYVSDIVLYRSELKQSGAVYTKLHSVSLN